MDCQKCGSVNEEYANYCFNCGTALKTETRKIEKKGGLNPDITIFVYLLFVIVSDLLGGLSRFLISYYGMYELYSVVFGVFGFIASILLILMSISVKNMTKKIVAVIAASIHTLYVLGTTAYSLIEQLL